MVPKLVSSTTVFDAAKLAASFAPVPGLEAGITVIQMIYNAAKNVQLHDAKCKSLGDAAVAVLETIRDNAPTAEPTKLDKTVQKTLSTLEDTKRDMQHWSQYTVVQSFYYRHDIEDSIQEHGDSMQQCLDLLGVAAALQMTDVALILKKGREEDSGKLDEILQNQKIMMQALTELHEMLQNLPAQSQERSKASKALVQLRKDEVNLGRIGDLPSELKGEVVKKSLVRSGDRCDVWKGSLLDDEYVALRFYRVFKRPDEQGKNMERFERQINLWRALDHPNILALYGWCFIDGDICLVSPWMRNQDVRNYRAKENPSDEKKLQIAIEIVQGLQYLHSRELLHGDVKPSNILIDGGGHVKLGDFTLLKLLAHDDHGPLNSQSSCDLKGLLYQPPEVMREEKVTPAADIYSWAICFLVIASGVQPFPKHKNIPQLLALISSAEVPKLEDYPCTVFTTYPLLWALLERCWNREPTARPSATDLLQSLNALKAQGVVV